MEQKYFTIYDYIILVAILLLSIIIGLVPVYFNKHKLKKQRSRKPANDETDIVANLNTNKNENTKLEEYLVGSRNLMSLPVALSILASIFSANTIVGLTGEIYVYGAQTIITSIPITIGALVSGFVFFPLIRKLKIITLYEYFHLRYNSLFIRISTALSYLTYSILWTGTAIYSVSTSLSVVTGINVYICAVVISMVTMIYTTFGGIRGVIWCDVFQLIMMLCGLIYIIIKGSIIVGGFGNVWELSSNNERLDIFNFSINPFIRQTFWSILFGGSIRWFLHYSAEQTVVQRFFSAKSNRDAQYAMIINMIGSVLFYNLCAFIGLVVYANYANCDPLKGGKITGVKNPNQLFAYFVNDKLNTVPGISGFIQGILLSATLSTLSSVLNSQAAVLWNDCLKQVSYFKSFSDRKSIFLTKCLVIIFGFMSLLFTFILAATRYINVLEIIIYLSNVLKPPVGLLLILGVFVYLVNKYGAFAGFITCLGVSLWLLSGSIIVKPQYPKLKTNAECYNISSVSNTTSNLTNYGEALNVTGYNRIYSISFLLINLAGFLPGLLVAIIVSILSGGLKNRINKDLLLWSKNRNKKNSRI